MPSLLGLEVQKVVSCHVGVRTLTLVLWKSELMLLIAEPLL